MEERLIDMYSSTTVTRADPEPDSGNSVYYSCLLNHKDDKYYCKENVYVSGMPDHQLMRTAHICKYIPKSLRSYALKIKYGYKHFN